MEVVRRRNRSDVKKYAIGTVWTFKKYGIGTTKTKSYQTSKDKDKLIFQHQTNLQGTLISRITTRVAISVLKT